jgi:hypothetical protein
MKDRGNGTKTAKKKAPKEVSSIKATCNGLDVIHRRNKIATGIGTFPATDKNRKSFGKSRIICFRMTWSWI